MLYNIIELTSAQFIRKFIDLPNFVYQNNQYYVQPLRSEVKDKINPRKNPFLKYGIIKLFGVINNESALVGRIVAIINPNYDKIHGIKCGFFGMFESINDIQVASLLINRVKMFLKEKDCSMLVGPVNFTTNDESGVLIDGFNYEPSFMCSYNENYYPILLEHCGLKKGVDLLAFIGFVDHMYPEKFSRIINRVKGNPNIVLRTFDKNKKNEDTETICKIYNESFKDVWGFVPLTLDEANNLTKKFLAFYDPELIWIAFVGRKPVGFILGLPDINKILKTINGRLFPVGIIKFYLNKNKIDSLRVLALGVLPAFRGLGLESILINKIHSRMKTKVYKTAELSFIIENNYRMRKVLENLGFKVYKRYRIYKANI